MAVNSCKGALSKLEFLPPMHYCDSGKNDRKAAVWRTDRKMNKGLKDLSDYK